MPKKKYSRPLTPRQLEALTGIYEHGLMRTQGPGYWQWRWRTTGRASNIASITVESLIRLKLAAVTYSAGLELCKLTPAGVEAKP